MSSDEVELTSFGRGQQLAEYNYGVPPGRREWRFGVCRKQYVETCHEIPLCDPRPDMQGETARNDELGQKN